MFVFVECLSLWNKWPLNSCLCGVLMIFFKGIRQLNVFWFYIVTGLDVGKGVA